MKFLYTITSGEVVLGKVTGYKATLNGEATSYTLNDWLERHTDECFETFEEAKSALLTSRNIEHDQAQKKILRAQAHLDFLRVKAVKQNGLTVNDVRVL